MSKFWFQGRIFSQFLIKGKNMSNFFGFDRNFGLKRKNSCQNFGIKGQN